MAGEVRKNDVIVTKDGLMIPVNKVERVKDVAESIVQNAYLAPYEGDELEHLGKTNLQVAAEKVAANMAKEGDAGEFHRALDRIIGKPKQHNENVNLQADLKDFLDGVAINNSDAIDAEYSEVEDGE